MGFNVRLFMSLFLLNALLFHCAVSNNQSLSKEDIERAKRNSNVIFNPSTNSLEWSEGPNTYKYCMDTKINYGIEPGKSFGTLPFVQHSTYLRAKCHRYFCEPNAMAGQGKFDCVKPSTSIDRKFTTE